MDRELDAIYRHGKTVSKAKHDLLFHHQRLESTLTFLVNEVPKGGYTTEQLQSKLKAAKATSGDIGMDLKQVIDARFYNCVKLPNSTIATKVFYLPELLELILNHLSAWDILSMSQTCRFIKDAIHTYPTMPVKLCLQPAPQENATFTPFPDFRCPRQFSVMEYGRSSKTGARRVTVSIRTKASGILPRIGSRWSKMLFTQPPIKAMKIMVPCCSRGLSTTMIVSEQGLTIVDLLKTAKQHMNLHPECHKTASGTEGQDCVKDPMGIRSISFDSCEA